MAVAIAFLCENAVEAISVQNHKKKSKKSGEHKVITPKQQFLGIILCFLCI